MDTDRLFFFFACLAVIAAGSANGSGRHLRRDWMCVSLLLPLQGFNLPLLLILLSIQHTAFSTPCGGTGTEGKRLGIRKLELEEGSINS